MFKTDRLSGYVTQSVAVLLTIVAATAATAQTGSATLEEVIVTAQRKSESLQEVPIAVTALSSEIIEKTGTHELSGVAIQVPGLTFSAFSPGQNLVSLRGAASNDDGAGTDGSVAIFVDDVYLGRISNINPELFDLERIEVLRGPQGTLYGKNTIGGAINIVSSKPNLDEFEGKIKAGYGNYDRVTLAALLTGPLSENWAYKISASHRVRDGWATNRHLNKRQKDDKAGGVKAQLLFDKDDVEALLSFDFNTLNVEDMGRVPVRADYEGIGPGANPAVFRAAYEAVCGDVTGSKCTAGPADGHARRKALGLSARVRAALSDQTELTTITAYRESEADWNMDSIGAPALTLNDDIFDTTRQFSQEIRFAHTLDDKINYVIGLWYLNEVTDRTECFDLDGFGPAARGIRSIAAGTDCTPLTDGSEGYNQKNKTQSLALFGQADILLRENLTLTLGGRVSYEEKSIVSRAVTNEQAERLGECVGRGAAATASGLCIIAQSLDPLAIKESWSAFTPRVSVNYAASDNINLYVTYAKGFKSGGFPAAPQTQEDARRVLEQEEADSVELGFKSLFGGIFRLNVSLFYTEYKGLQIQNFGTPADQPGTFGRFLTFNAGSGEVKGVEAEATWLIRENLTATAFIGTNDSKFGVTNIANGAANANQEGNDLLRTPKLKYGVGVDYDLPFVGGSSLNFGGNYNYTASQRGDLPSYALQPAFGLLDARVGWRSSDDAVDISVWFKNLLDEEYISHIYTVAGGNVIAVYGEPTMYGVNVTYRF